MRDIRPYTRARARFALLDISVSCLLTSMARGDLPRPFADSRSRYSTLTCRLYSQHHNRYRYHVSRIISRTTNHCRVCMQYTRTPTTAVCIFTCALIIDTVRTCSYHTYLIRNTYGVFVILGRVHQGRISFPSGFSFSGSPWPSLGKTASASGVLDPFRTAVPFWVQST